MKFAFLVYAPRSGSTYLARLISEAPSRVIVLPEYTFTQQLLAREDSAIASMDSADYEALIARDHRLVEDLAQSAGPTALAQNAAGQGRRGVFEALVSALHPAESLVDAVVLIKYGEAALAGRKIFVSMPEAKFVHIVRDGRAVANSLMRTERAYYPGESMGRDDIVYSARLWRSHVRVLSKLIKTRPDAVVEVRYEDLLTDTDVAVECVTRFLESKTDESGSKPFALHGAEQSIHPLLQADPMTERSVAWKDELVDGELLLCEMLIGQDLVDRGYSLLEAPSAGRLVKGATLAVSYVKHWKAASTWFVSRLWTFRSQRQAIVDYGRVRATRVLDRVPRRATRRNSTRPAASQDTGKQRRLLLVATIEPTLTGFLAQFADHMRSVGWQVDGLSDDATQSPRSDSFDRLIDAPWKRRNWNPYLSWRGIKAVQARVAEGDYDVVHVHTPTAALLTRFAIRNESSVAVLYTCHGFHFHSGAAWLHNVVFRSLEKLAGRWTDLLIVINREDQDAAVKHRIMPGEKVRLIPGIGIDLASFRRENMTDADIAAKRKEFRLRDGASLFLAVGELNPEKRHGDVVEAIATLPHKNVHLAIAGTGPLHDELLAQADRLGIADRVHLLGWRGDVRELLVAADALVHASSREGLPRAVMEAMALETLVVGAAARGTADLLVDGGGLLYDVADTEQLVEQLTFVVDHPFEARRLGLQGRAAVEPLDVPGILREYEEVYESLV